MQKSHENSTSVNTALLEMGYSQEMISLALKETKKKSLEHILDLLVSKEAEYKTILESSQPSKADSISSGKDENGESDEEDSENGASKNMDEESINYLESAIQAFKGRKPKDSNWYIIELADQLKTINFKTNEGATRVRYYLDNGEYYPKIEEYKKLAYTIICKSLNVQKGKKLKINFTEFETLLTLAFELHLLRYKGMGNVLMLYQKYCAKQMYKPNEEVLARLENCHKEAQNAQNDGMEENLFVDDALEEEKVEGASEPQKELINIDGKENEYCIICMQKVREIVFMPCCHFLTCQLCSARIGKCPVCNNKIHKHLQIFWS